MERFNGAPKGPELLSCCIRVHTRSGSLQAGVINLLRSPVQSCRLRLRGPAATGDGTDNTPRTKPRCSEPARFVNTDTNDPTGVWGLLFISTRLPCDSLV